MENTIFRLAKSRNQAVKCPLGMIQEPLKTRNILMSYKNHGLGNREKLLFSYSFPVKRSFVIINNKINENVEMVPYSACTNYKATE